VRAGTRQTTVAACERAFVGLAHPFAQREAKIRYQGSDARLPELSCISSDQRHAIASHSTNLKAHGRVHYHAYRNCSRVKETTLPLDYPREQVWNAVSALVTGSGRIQERLYSAMLCMVGVQPCDFPEDSRNEFEDLQRELTREKAVGDEGNLTATIRKLSDEDAGKFAERIWKLYTDLRRSI
jgi:hypothetical protein